jgi:hypothetical protein
VKKLLILAFVLVYPDVDVVIFSSNNILTLNLCLESLNRFAKNIGQISVIYYADNLPDRQLYNKLIDAKPDLFFKRAFLKNNIIRDLYLVLSKSKSNFALCLTDDMILTRAVDLNFIENTLGQSADVLLLTVGQNSWQLNNLLEQDQLKKSANFATFEKQAIKDSLLLNIFGAAFNKQSLKSLYKLTREHNLVKFNEIYFQKNLKFCCLVDPIAVKLQENKNSKLRQAYSEIFIKKNFKIEIAEILQNYANQNVLSTEFIYRAIS